MARGGTDDAALREAVLASCRAMHAAGLSHGTSGNAGVRAGAGVLVTPSGMPYADMTPGDLVWIPLASGRGAPRRRGRRRPTTEWRLHRDVLAARPEVGAVLHTHSPHATALAVLGLDMPAHHYMVALSGGASIRCAPYARFGSAALSRHAVAALEGRTCCLLANHGVVTLGATPAGALALAGEVGALARIYLLARAAGEPRVIDDAEMRALAAPFQAYGARSR